MDSTIPFKFCLQFQYTEPKVHYSDEPFEASDAGSEIVSESIETNRGIYKKIDTTSPWTKKQHTVKDLPDISNLDLKIQHSLLKNFVKLGENLELDDKTTKKMIEVDLREWTAPFLEVRVNITVYAFFQTYLIDYHDHFSEIVDTKDKDGLSKMIEIIGDKYSKISMFSSFVKFVAGKVEQNDQKQFLEEVHDQF